MEQKKKIGRPKKDSSEVLDDIIRVRSTTEWKEQCLKKAKKAGFNSLSKWFRYLADAA